MTETTGKLSIQTYYLLSMQQFCKIKSSYKVPDTDVRSGGGGGGGKKGGGQVVANVQFGGLQFCRVCRNAPNDKPCAVILS